MDLDVLEKYRVEEAIKTNAEFNRFGGEIQTEWSWTNLTEDTCLQMQSYPLFLGLLAVSLISCIG